MTSLELQQRYTCSRLHFNYASTGEILSRDAGLDGAPLHFSLSDAPEHLLLVSINQTFLMGTETFGFFGGDFFFGGKQKLLSGSSSTLQEKKCSRGGTSSIFSLQEINECVVYAHCPRLTANY